MLSFSRAYIRILIFKVTAVKFMCGYKQQGILALAFGLGLTLSFLFPESLIIIIISIILVILSIALIKC